jgi:general secretion pathway protein I
MAMNQRGMTLIEVMVAMAVLAMAGLALLKTSHEQVRNMNALEQKQIAGWVADNQLTLQMLRPSPGSGIQQQAGRVWYWRVTYVPTSQPGVTAVEVEVRDRQDDRDPLVRLNSWRLD